MLWRAIVLSSCLVASYATNDKMWRIINTTQGPVRGRMEPDGIYAFYNIPYARAPTGVNKFKAPLPPPRWKTQFVAIDKGVICPQAKIEPTITLRNKTIQENCLKANVYIPNTEEKNLSVVLFVHGGAFQVGYGNHRKAKTLMKSKKIITVTFNYRLGVHGFLCLGTKDIPGNAGMKDIVAMLRWLKKNIAYFGGNPNDVTVSGYSAGAIAVDLLILSKSANGLFQKVIIESGASTVEFAVQSDPLETAKMHALMLNFTNVGNIYDLERFYKTMSFKMLNSKQYLDTIDYTFVFSPCIENDIGEDVFLSDAPINILNKGDYTKVPTLYGFTNMEGLMRASFFDRWITAMTVKFSDFLPSDLIFSTEKEKEDVAKQIKDFYFGELPVGTSSILNYIDYLTDVMFASPALRSVSLNVASGNYQIYLYYYSFVDDNEPFIADTKIRGANHCAQSLVIFDDLVPRSTSLKFKMLRKTMRHMWHNFIITGKPISKGSFLNLTWPPTTVDRSPHMSFGQVIKLGGELLERRARFWDNIYETFYRKPVPPPIPPPSKEMLTFGIKNYSNKLRYGSRIDNRHKKKKI